MGCFLRTGAQIFDLNKLNYQAMPAKERDQLLKDFLTECYDREGIAGQTDPPLAKESSINPMLSKYFYVHRPEVINTQDQDKQKLELSATSHEMSQSKLKGITGITDPKVKLEAHAEAKECLKVIDSAKNKLDKDFNGCVSAFKDLKVSVLQPSPEMKKVLDELEKGLKTIEGQIDKIRADSAKASHEIKDGMDKQVAKDWVQLLTKYKDEAIAHQDGLKLLKKRVQTLSDEFSK